MESIVTIRPDLLAFGPEQFMALSPLLAVFAGAVICTLLAAIPWISSKWLVFAASIATCAAGLTASVAKLSVDPVTLFDGMLVVDSYGAFFSILFLGSALLTILISFRYLDREGVQHPEYYILLLFSVIGMMLLSSSLDLLVIFISLELMSLMVYTLVSFRRADRRCNEAALKYFILGGAASAVMLFGAAFLYGATGSMNIMEILKFIQTGGSSSDLFVLGVWFVIVGFLFKVASVPFHMWMPDVYEGAPVPVTGFMTTGLKAAAFATFVRVFISLGYGHGLVESVQKNLHDILWVCALLTMLVGNIVALVQTNLKRMLGYSSIAHTGYLMIGMISGIQSQEGYAPVLLYLVAYSVMNMGAFVVLTLLSARSDQALNLHDMAGVARRHPILAFCMAVFLFSMAGIPPTAGFMAKYLLMYAAVQAGEILLVVLAVLTTVVSVYYYLRVLVYMYMREPVGAPANSRVPVWSAAALAATVFLTLQLGLMPGQLVELARKAVAGL